MPRVSLHINRAGFSTVELLLSVSIFGVLALGAIGGIVGSQSSTAQAGNRSRANLLAEEGLEAVRNIRDAAYSNLSDGTYGLIRSGDIWTLSGSQDVTGIFTRQIIISSPNTNVNIKTVTSRVTWSRGVMGTGQAEAVTRMTWWSNTLTKVWDNAYLRYKTDLTGTNGGTKVFTTGGYAYMVRTDGSPDFIVLSLSSTNAPTAIGSLTLAGEPTNIFVSGNYAYVSSRSDSSELQIIDISTPASPTLIGVYDAAGVADGLGIYVVGSAAYLSRAANGGDSEFVIVNASTPALPTLTGALHDNNTFYEVHVAGLHAYIASSNDSEEIVVVSLTTPSAPTIAASLNLNGTADAITLIGYPSRLLVGQGAVFHTISTSNPLALAELGNVTLSGIINDVGVNNTNTLAYIGNNDPAAEFQAISINTETSPTLLKSVDAPGSSVINGVWYNASLDKVIGASNNSSQEVLMFSPN